MNGRVRNVIINMRSHGKAITLEMMPYPRTAANMVKRGLLVRDGTDDYGRPLYRLAENAGEQA